MRVGSRMQVAQRPPVEIGRQVRPLDGRRSCGSANSRSSARRCSRGRAPRRPARCRRAVDDALSRPRRREAGEVVLARGYMPGISAVSPPISAQPACSQPAAMPLTTSVATATSSLPQAKVVEEEQRLGALHQDVVHAHRHEVDADGVVAVQLEGELELGADAVGAGDQHRLAVVSGTSNSAPKPPMPASTPSRRCGARTA
jgi:hypothetical protein